MIILRQKEFNSKAQKARRAKWEIEEAVKKAQPDTEEYIRNSAKRIQKKTNEAGISLSKKDAINAARKRLSRGEGGEFKMAMNSGKWRTMDALHGTNDNIKRGGVDSMKIAFDKLNFKRHIKESKPSTDLFKKEAEEDYINKIKPELDRKEKRQKSKLGNRVGLERAKKRDLVARRRATGALRERVEAYKAKKAKAKASAESIAKHEAKAAELRAKKLAGEKLAKNLKKAGKVGIGVAGAAGIGYGIKKAVDKNKKEHN